jgi:O-antigen/teichoic acid export membrane protein
VFRAHERMDRDAALNVVCKLMTLLASIACFAMGGRLIGLIWAWGIAGCLTLAAGAAMYRRLRLPGISVTVRTVRELLRDGSPLFAFALAVSIEPYINANILYHKSPPSVVGWFGAAWSIAGTLIAPATILATAMYPRFCTAADNPDEFKRTFDVCFRPLLLLAALGGVGTYLFADVPVSIIYSLQRFAPAADTLRAFAIVIPLMYVDVFLGLVIVAAGGAGRLAGTKVAAVVLTTGLAFFLIPFSQARFANGGLGVMYAIAIGELPMLIASLIIMRAVVDRHTIADLVRTTIAGAASVFLVRLLPPLTPVLTIPFCVLVFAGVAMLTGAVRRSDVKMLLTSYRRAPPVVAPSEASALPTDNKIGN